MNTDDWRAETQGGLSRSMIYKALREKCADDSAGKQVLALVDDATYYAYQRTKTIVKHMGEFTLHDGDHLFRVLTLMEKLLSKEQIPHLSVPELMLLILAAFFHDIGMAPDEKDVLAWKKIWDLDPLFDGEKEKQEAERFLRFCKTRPEKYQKIKNLVSAGDLSGAQSIQDYLVTDYIRQTHADRARQIIEQDWSDKVRYRDMDLSTEFAQICFSHNEDATGVLDQDKNLLCGPDIYACLPLVSVILRLADLLDFDAKRTPNILFSHLFVRHPVSLIEWNKHRAIQARTISREKIRFHATCTHPAIESSIREFCDVIDLELSTCNNVISTLNEFHADNDRAIHLKLPLKVDRSKIQAKQDISNRPLYLYRETKFNLSKSQVIDLLMGTKLYGDTSVALRELVQNSIDACLLRASMESSWGNSYAPKISIKYFAEGDQDILEVTDNGTGMDQKIIDEYYSKVGSSFYKSTEFYDIRSQAKSTFIPTSRFGIGILSCFMVSDLLMVETRRLTGQHESSPPLNITVEGQDSLFVIKNGSRESPGTTTKLVLRKENHPWKKLSVAKFTENVENTIRNPPFTIYFECGTECIEIKKQSFVSASAKAIKDVSWSDHDNVKEFNVELNDESWGIAGSATIAIVEQNESPVFGIELSTKNVMIEKNEFKLEKELILTGSEIRLKSTSISIDDKETIKSSNLNTVLVKSKSRISLHGIDVPISLFPEYWNKQQNQATLDWPMPMLVVFDIFGSNDLDLNSARTQLLTGEKWNKLEQKLAELVFSGIKNQVSEIYWKKLKTILLEASKNEIFLNTLNEY